ncbi:MAG: hypothetical protein FWE56_05660, partial [Candidatus Bathyarchaeota archaeon]|nr:hypothetical protein [Candidatus Termiticorpusculum sp.]
PAPLNYAILGTWGQGKTSIAYKLKEIALNELQNQIQCACIYFPLMPQYCQNWDTFTENFLKKSKNRNRSHPKHTAAKNQKRNRPMENKPKHRHNICPKKKRR